MMVELGESGHFVQSSIYFSLEELDLVGALPEFASLSSYSLYENRTTASFKCSFGINSASNMELYRDVLLELQRIRLVLRALKIEYRTDFTIWFGTGAAMLNFPYETIQDFYLELGEIWAEGEPSRSSSEHSDEVRVAVIDSGGLASENYVCIVGDDATLRQRTLESFMASALSPSAGSHLAIELHAHRGIAGVVVTAKMMEAILQSEVGISLRNVPG